MKRQCSAIMECVANMYLVVNGGTVSLFSNCNFTERDVVSQNTLKYTIPWIIEFVEMYHITHGKIQYIEK